MRKRQRHRMPNEMERRRRNLRFFAVCLCLVAFVVYIDSRIRPVIESMAAYQAKVFALKSINDAIAAELSESGLVYGDLITVTQNTSGEVTSIQTNMVEINNFKTRVTDTVVQDLQRTENQSLYIPLGTLAGNQLLSGRGPRVEIQVVPTGYAQTSIYNKFTAAGINQTLHQIMLEINIQMIAIVPGYTVRTDTVTNYCIAETVIVGHVPDGYTRIEGDDSSTISKINDYEVRP